MTIMKLFASLLIAASSVSVAHGAAGLCEGICEISLNLPCAQALEELEFTGDCCTLKERDDGICLMVSTSHCYVKRKGDTGCQGTAHDGMWACVVPGMSWSSTSDEPCPATEFEIPMLMTDAEGVEEVDTTDDNTTSVVTTAVVPEVTDAPAATDAPTSAATTTLVGISSLVAGAALLAAQLA